MNVDTTYLQVSNELVLYVQKNKDAILPTDEQIEAFAKKVLTDHSWNKRLQNNDSFFLVYIATEDPGKYSENDIKKYGHLRYTFACSAYTGWFGNLTFPEEIARSAVRAWSEDRKTQLVQAGKNIRTIFEHIKSNYNLEQ